MSDALSAKTSEPDLAALQNAAKTVADILRIEITNVPPKGIKTNLSDDVLKQALQKSFLDIKFKQNLEMLNSASRYLQIPISEKALNDIKVSGKASPLHIQGDSIVGVAKPTIGSNYFLTTTGLYYVSPVKTIYKCSLSAKDFESLKSSKKATMNGLELEDMGGVLAGDGKNIYLDALLVKLCNGVSGEAPHEVAIAKVFDGINPIATKGPEHLISVFKREMRKYAMNADVKLLAAEAAENLCKLYKQVENGEHGGEGIAGLIAEIKKIENSICAKYDKDYFPKAAQIFRYDKNEWVFRKDGDPPYGLDRDEYNQIKRQAFLERLSALIGEGGEYPKLSELHAKYSKNYPVKPGATPSTPTGDAATYAGDFTFLTNRYNEHTLAGEEFANSVTKIIDAFAGTGEPPSPPTISSQKELDAAIAKLDFESVQGNRIASRAAIVQLNAKHPGMGVNEIDPATDSWVKVITDKLNQTFVAKHTAVGVAAAEKILKHKAEIDAAVKEFDDIITAGKAAKKEDEEMPEEDTPAPVAVVGEGMSVTEAGRGQKAVVEEGDRQEEKTKYSNMTAAEVETRLNRLIEMQKNTSKMVGEAYSTLSLGAKDAFKKKLGVEHDNDDKRVKKFMAAEERKGEADDSFTEGLSTAVNIPIAEFEKLQKDLRSVIDEKQKKEQEDVAYAAALVIDLCEDLNRVNARYVIDDDKLDNKTMEKLQTRSINLKREIDKLKDRCEAVSAAKVYDNLSMGLKFSFIDELDNFINDNTYQSTENDNLKRTFAEKDDQEKMVAIDKYVALKMKKLTEYKDKLGAKVDAGTTFDAIIAQKVKVDAEADRIGKELGELFDKQKEGLELSAIVINEQINQIGETISDLEKISSEFVANIKLSPTALQLLQNKLSLKDGFEDLGNGGNFIVDLSARINHEALVKLRSLSDVYRSYLKMRKFTCNSSVSMIKYYPWNRNSQLQNAKI